MTDCYVFIRYHSYKSFEFFGKKTKGVASLYTDDLREGGVLGASFYLSGLE